MVVITMKLEHEGDDANRYWVSASVWNLDFILSVFGVVEESQQETDPIKVVLIRITDS